MNIEELAQPPEPPEKRAESDRKLAETVDRAVRNYSGTPMPQFSTAMPEPARDYAAERLRTVREEAHTEGFLEGLGIALALFKRTDRQEALESIEQMIKELEAQNKG